MSGLSQYDPAEIHVSPFPNPERCGDGWWRKRWEVETATPFRPTLLRLPALEKEIEDRPLVVGVLPLAAHRVTVEVLTSTAPMQDEEVVYVSFVMQAIQELAGRIFINGEVNHAILGMALPDRWESGPTTSGDSRLAGRSDDQGPPNLPSPNQDVNGWWHWGWQANTEELSSGRDLRLPCPAELRNLKMIVVIRIIESGWVGVELITRHKQLTRDEVRYVGSILVAIGARNDEISPEA